MSDEPTEDEVQAARTAGQAAGLEMKLGKGNRAYMGEGLTPSEYDHDSNYSRATAWVEGYNEGLEVATKEAAEKDGKEAHAAGVAAGAAAGAANPPSTGHGHEGELPHFDVPPQYAAHAEDFTRGFAEGYPKVEGPAVTTGEAEPSNYEEAMERAEAYVHLRRKLQDEIDPSYVRQFESKWGAFPVPELLLGEKAAPGEFIVLHEQPHIEAPESGVVE